ncbi:MAG: DUF2225 domain-containing protein [Alkalispirochaeta sp.]
MAASLTFFSKKPISCPVCDEKIFREEMRTGRGRQIAGNLTRELRRNYEVSKQYGEVYPLIYPVTVCPNCYYAVFDDDFLNVPDKLLSKLEEEIPKRQEALSDVFPELDFTQPRGLPEGVASYVFATMCYEHFPRQFSPLFKSGLSQLRAAWLCKDLHKRRPTENFDYMAAVFYRKARYYYSRAVEGEQDGSQPLSGAKNLGPDIDKNYGYDGVLYLSGLLEFEYGPRSDPQMRRNALSRAKRTVARIFGMGKASKNKPAAILDNARDVYELIGKELDEGEADPEE